MNSIFIQNHAFNKSQNGYMLIVVLLIMGVLGSILTGVSVVKSKENLLNEAKIAGWEGALISRAARIYARDLVTLNPNLKNSLATTPVRVSLQTLIDLSLLPPNFAREEGGQYFNALNQRISVYLANYPIDGDPADPKTSATAYVTFDRNDKTTAELMYDVANSLFNNQLPVQAPVFDNGNNLSGTCGATNSVSRWDSGCISAAQYQILTSQPFEEGGLIIPAWQSVNFDTRALLRFPAVEDNGQSTMLTDLKMAVLKNCANNSADYITIPSDTGVNQETNFCGAVSDDALSATPVDNRRSIVNVGNLSGNYYITDAQAGLNGVYTDYQTNISTIEPHRDIAIQGNLTANGSVKSYSGSVNVGQNLIVDRNINLSSEGAAVPPSASLGNLNTGRIFTDDLTVEQRINSPGDISISSNASNISNVNVDNELLANNLIGIGANHIVNISNNLDVTNAINARNLNVSGQRNINGFSAIAGVMKADDINVNGNVAVTDTAYLRATANTRVTNITNSSNSAECFGDCPRRTADEQCRNLAAAGIQSYEDCMAGF